MAQGVPDRLRPRIFFTFRHHKGGRSSAKRTGCLYPRRNPWYSLSGALSTSGHMVLLEVPRKKSPVTPPGIDPGTVRLVAQCLNHYAIPGPKLHCTASNRSKNNEYRIRCLWVIGGNIAAFVPWDWRRLPSTWPKTRAVPVGRDAGPRVIGLPHFKAFWSRNFTFKF